MPSRKAPYSLGETLIGRRLERERRAGVDHYVPGQRQAKVDEEGIGFYTYVDAGGRAVLVICEFSGHWEPRIIVRSGVMVCTSPMDANVIEYKLSDDGRQLLNQAKEKANANRSQ